MTNMTSVASTRTSRIIKAPREALYRAFTDPIALAAWLSPGEMTGKVHEFERPRQDLGAERPVHSSLRGGTEVTMRFEHIPPGIRPEDNDAGTRSSLEKLARYVE
jgi:uncharacterized protein YndB with AHSA1/START domain